MATEKQVEANRKNAKRSTGPKTPEGKEAVRLNALKHGMRADSFEVIRGENPAEFAERLAGWNISYDPTGPVEANLVRRAVVLSWRIDRATRFENAVLNRRVHDAVMACDCGDDDVEALTEAAGLAFFDASDEGEKLRRYQFALNRDMHRTLAELAKLQRRSPRQQMDKMMVVNGAIFDTMRQGFQSAADAEEALRLAGIEIVDPEAWRRSFEPDTRGEAPDPAPNEANSAAPNEANSADARHESPAPAGAVDCEPASDSAPNEANSPAPNKANSADEPAADPAPKRAISARGARELERFIAAQARRDARDGSWVDISIDKR